MSQTTLTVAKVQAQSGISSGTNISQATLTSNVTAGNTLIAATFAFGSADITPPNLASVTDNQGNVWTFLANVHASNSRGALWMCGCAKGGATTVTFTPPSQDAESCVLVYELSGADQNYPPEVYVAAGAQSQGMNVATGTFTTVKGGDFLIAFMGQGQTTTTNSAGSGWGALDLNNDGSGGYGLASEYIQNAAPGTYNGTFTTANNVWWVALAIAIKVKTLPNLSTLVRDPIPADSCAGVGDFWVNTANGRIFQCRDNTNNAARWVRLNQMVSVKDFGARGDAIRLTNATITNNSPGAGTLYSPSANFTQADVGKTVVIVVSAGSYLTTTISSVQDSHDVTLASQWTFSTASNATVLYGTDDSAAVRAAVAFAISLMVPLYFPEGNYPYNATLCLWAEKATTEARRHGGASPVRGHTPSEGILKGAGNRQDQSGLFFQFAIRPAIG